MSMRGALAAGGVVLALWAQGAATGQIVPKDAAVPVQVIKGKGEFAKRLQGQVMPTGKGWKGVTDRETRLQLMLPDKWKVNDFPNGDIVFTATPPGSGKATEGVLMVLLSAPRDADPFEVSEELALSHADELEKTPMFQKLGFKATDAGYVVARGLKLALAGGTMKSADKKGTVQQQQLIYVGEDRIVTVQFTANEKDFPKYADDLARIFASYQNLGVRKLAE